MHLNNVFVTLLRVSTVICLSVWQAEKTKGKKMSINLKNKKELVEKYGKNAQDTGNVDVQVAMLTQKISELTEHLKANAKDFQAKRGLLMMVGKRKRMLAYIKERDLNRYRDLVKKLKLRG